MKKRRTMADFGHKGETQFIRKSPLIPTHRSFNNCIDGLVLVDLTRLKPARYQRYIAVHQVQESRLV
ncbi:hypothetical protein [Serratia sp. D1N4]